MDMDLVSVLTRLENDLTTAGKATEASAIEALCLLLEKMHIDNVKDFKAHVQRTGYPL